MRDIKKEMTMIKGGDFLEWYDSLDAIERAQYKVEFNKLQESHETPFDVILNNSKNRFEEDLIQGRVNKATEKVVEWVEEYISDCIREVMSDYNLIPYDENLDWDVNKLDERFAEIEKGVIHKIYNNYIYGC